jgi:hypothetical protein
MFLDGVIGRRGMTIQLPPSILANNIILKSIKKVEPIKKGEPLWPKKEP